VVIGLIARYSLARPPSRTRLTANCGIIGKSVNDASGKATVINSLKDLNPVGKSYGLLKLLSDAPHWSDDGQRAMRITHRIMLAFSCVAATTCVAGPTRQARIETGFVATRDGSAFFYSTDDQLTPASTIQLQYPAAKGAVACCLRLQGDALGAPSGSIQPVSDALFGRPLFRYPLKQFPAALKGDPFIGAAVIGARSVSVDADSAGTIMQVKGAATSAKASTVEICLGSEGSNLFLIENGKLKSQIYYSFGYDVTATCDPKLFELPTAR
jgi:hypothetical protein